jgi:hypothetical protein
MSLNFQDVLRDVHDPTNHALQISGTIQAAGQATVSLLGTPTVMIGTSTLYAVVNTSAAGVGNSIVTINPRTDYIGLMSVSGNVNVGLPTVTVGNQTIYAVVNTIASSGQVTVTLNNTPTVYAVVNTVTAGIGNSIVTINPRTDYIGLMSISGNVAISNSTLYAVVNTAAAGVQNSIVTISPRVDYFGLVSVSGNVAVSSLPALSAGVAGIGFATVVVSNATLYAVVNENTGNVTVYSAPYSYYQQSSLVSGYVYHGFATPGSNPTTASFKILRENLNFGDVLFANGASSFVNIWSAASLSSIIYL